MVNDFVQVGQLGKSFGVEGFNRVKIFDDYLDFVQDQAFLFLEEDDYQVPFRVIEWRNDFSQIQFVDVLTKDQADIIQNKKVFLKKEDLPSAEKLPNSGFEGFTIINGEEEVGQILSVIEMPQQLMAVVSYKNQEIYIPLHENLIERVDSERATIVMELPDGLLEL